MGVAEEQFIEYEMRLKLNQLYRDGYCFIRWSELYHWFNANRLSKTSWWRIKTLWEETCARGGYADPLPVEIRGSDSDYLGGVVMIRAHDPDLDGSSRNLSNFG